MQEEKNTRVRFTNEWKTWDMSQGRAYPGLDRNIIDQSINQ